MSGKHHEINLDDALSGELTRASLCIERAVIDTPGADTVKCLEPVVGLISGKAHR